MSSASAGCSEIQAPDASRIRPGQPVVVGVDVGHHDTLDVGDVAPGLLHAGRQRAEGVVGVPAGVDQVRTAVGLEEVDEDVAQRVVGQRHRDAPQARAGPSRPPGRGRWPPRRPGPARRGRSGAVWCVLVDVEVTTGPAGSRGSPSPALGDHVPHDLVRSSCDGPGTSVKEGVLPAPILLAELVPLDHHGTGPQQGQRGLGDLQVQLAEPDLRHGGVGRRDLPPGRLGGHALAQVALDAGPGGEVPRCCWRTAPSSMAGRPPRS